MPVVRGENVGLFFFDDTVWKLFACGRSCTLSVSTEMIETSVSGSGKWRSYQPKVNGFRGSFDGVVFLEEAGMLTLPELRALQVSHTQLMFRMQRTDEDGNVYTDEGRVLIENTTDAGTYNDVNTYNLEFIGTGPLTQVFTLTPIPIPNIEMRHEYEGSGGEYGFTEPTLIGKYILAVVKDGIGNARIITSGTPVGKEVKYISATGEFEFAVPFEPGEVAYVNYRSL